MHAPATRHTIGGNNPPVKDLLAENYYELCSNASAALESAGRAPEIIEDETTLGKVGDLVRYITTLCKNADDARKAEKEPFLTAGRDVDSFFSAVSDPLAGAKKTLLTRSTRFLAEKEAAARAKAEADAKTAREEEDRRMAEASRAQDEGRFDDADKNLAQAAIAETRAAEATVAATAKPSELARTYSSGGSVSTLKKEWTFAIEDRAAISLDLLRPYIPADAIDKAIRAYVRAGNRTLAGVKIYEAPKAMVR